MRRSKEAGKGRKQLEKRISFNAQGEMKENKLTDHLIISHKSSYNQSNISQSPPNKETRRNIYY